MDIKQRIKAFNNLGNWLSSYFADNKTNTNYNNLENVIIKAKVKNQWFTPEYSKLALKAWANLLTTEKLEQWLSAYTLNVGKTKDVGIIMAGNIPLVGFHDLLCVLLSGHTAVIKLSSNDEELMPFIIDTLVEIEPNFEKHIKVIERLKNPDVVIATGSNNTARYFETYFGKYPNIIRKNRNSVAVITGKESTEDLRNLADDLFLYFGLGCRNITKLYIPQGYKLDNVFENIIHYSDIANHNKYVNNYDYYRAIYLLNQEPFLENGFAIMRQNKNLGSPVAVINYEFYNSLEEVKTELLNQQENIQCVVSSKGVVENSIPFGDSQKPGLNDYADGVDTLAFLLKL